MMINKIIRYKANIIHCIGVLAILSLTNLLYPGVKEGYFQIFLLVCAITPILIITRPKNNFSVDLSFAVLTVLTIVLYAIVFWAYKDRLPMHISDVGQVPEELRGGWFSFENPLRLKLLFACSAISILISSLIRLVYFKFKILKS